MGARQLLTDIEVQVECIEQEVITSKHGASAKAQTLFAAASLCGIRVLRLRCGATQVFLRVSTSSRDRSSSARY